MLRCRSGASMAADTKLPVKHEEVSREPLLSPVRALVIFTVAVVALLGTGGLLLSQLMERRAVGGAESAAMSATATAGRLAPRAAQPTAAPAREVQLAQAAANTPPSVVPASSMATPSGQPGVSANPDSTGGTPLRSDSAAGAAAATARSAQRQAGRSQGAPGAVAQAQVGDDGQPGGPASAPTVVAVPSSGGGPRLPTSANLAGALIPVGPAGVTEPGALRFAQALAQGARTAAARPVGSDAALDELAQRVLSEELSSAQQRGFPQEDVIRREGATVRLEVVAVLPHTNDVKLASLTKDTQTLGVAAGVAQRAEPGYLPDLVVVAAVSYR